MARKFKGVLTSVYAMPYSLPGEMPPGSVFDLVAEGVKLKIMKTGGSGSLGITLPKEELRKRGLGSGDYVVMLPSEKPDTFELRLPPEDG